MILKATIYVIISVLFAFYSPSNSIDKRRYVLIKIINSLAMLYVIALSAPNLLLLKEIVIGGHQPIIALKSNGLYYLYIFVYIIVSGIVTALAFFLLLRRNKARKWFLMIVPLMIALTEIKHYFRALRDLNNENSEKYAMLFVFFSTSIWLMIYIFISLRKTRDYFESK